MKRLFSFVVVTAMFMMMFAGFSVASAEAPTYNEAPMLAELVANGEVPPVEERLPENPKLVNEIPEKYTADFSIGKYGGNLRTIRMDPKWDGTIWTSCLEYLINSPGRESEEFTPNLLESYEVSDDQSTFTFTLRKGVKWSDGMPLTTKDVAWKFEMDHANEMLTQVWPQWLRTGNKAEGGYGKLEVVDDYIFTLTFDGAYGGLILLMSGQGYEDWIAPAHYMEKYHIDTADPEFLQKRLDDYGYGPDEWNLLYELVDPNNWDVCCQEAIDCPNLWPWVASAIDGTTATFTRNPYYWKVDAAGNQLPYMDTATSYYVVDMETAAVRLLAGEIDFAYEWVPLEKVSMYLENAEAAGYTLLLNTILHRTAADIFLNQTYEDEAWQEVVGDIRFRKALNLAIDKDELVDAVYYEFAEPSTLTDPTYDPDAAAELLEEIGLTKGADGFLMTPSGKPLTIEIAYSEWMTQFTPTANLVAEMWRELGFNINMKFVENTLMDTLRDSNELMVSVHFSHGPVFPMFNDWGFERWGRLYHLYYIHNGAQGIEPPPEVMEFYQTVFSVSEVDSSMVPEVRQKLRDLMYENVFIIMPVENITQVSLVNSKLRNFPDAGFLLNHSGSMEQCWMDD